jgi:hypothetical protein
MYALEDYYLYVDRLGVRIKRVTKIITMANETVITLDQNMKIKFYKISEQL